MAEKPDKTDKRVGIQLVRSPVMSAPVLVATGFRLRVDKSLGLIDVFVEGLGSKNARVCFDPIIVKDNLAILTQYVTKVGSEPDDSAKKEDVTVSDPIYFANIVHLSHMGGRSETAFAAFRMYDWVEAAKKPDAKAVETKTADGNKAAINTYDILLIESTAAWQKKFVLELILALNQFNKE
jgi:hypothetical protein